MSAIPRGQGEAHHPAQNSVPVKDALPTTFHQLEPPVLGVRWKGSNPLDNGSGTQQLLRKFQKHPAITEGKMVRPADQGTKPHLDCISLMEFSSYVAK